MLSRNQVTIVTPKGPVQIEETEFDPKINRLARGSRIPASAAVFLGSDASAVLNSVAGDPELADAPGLVPIARTVQPGNRPNNHGGAHGSTNAIADAEAGKILPGAIGDASKANPENPKIAKKDELVENGQSFTARFKDGKHGVVTSHGEPLSEGRYDDWQEALSAFEHPTKERK